VRRGRIVAVHEQRSFTGRARVARRQLLYDGVLQ